MTQRRVMLVGPSVLFTSGITYYTYSLAGALANSAQCSVLLMRRLLPRFLYPGSRRVGDAVSTLTLPSNAPVFDGVDYFWGASILRARKFLRRQAPEVVVFQWWTGTVLHTYLALARLAKKNGAKVVIEFHETLDPGEQTRRLFHAYVRRIVPRLFEMADAYVVHSAFDRELVCREYGIDDTRVTVIPHAAYTHYRDNSVGPAHTSECTELLFFGLIRPVKGLEHLLDAFDRIPRDVVTSYHLTIVGEVWEGCDALVAGIPNRRNADRITVVNRYVEDKEVDRFFRAADVVVLPYTRSSQSGVLHIAMAYGLPVIASDIGGLPEALEGYGAHVLVPPADVDALLAALMNVDAMDRATPRSRHDWCDTAEALGALTDALTRTPPVARELDHISNSEDPDAVAV